MKNLTKKQIALVVVCGTAVLAGLIVLWMGTECTPEVLKIPVSEQTQAEQVAKTAESLALIAGNLSSHVRVAEGGGFSLALLILMSVLLFNKREILRGDTAHAVMTVTALVLIGVFATGAIAISVSAWLCGVIGGNLVVVGGVGGYIFIREILTQADSESEQSAQDESAT